MKRKLPPGRSPQYIAPQGPSCLQTCQLLLVYSAHRLGPPALIRLSFPCGKHTCPACVWQPAPRCECGMCLRVCAPPVFIAQPAECCGSYLWARPLHKGCLALLSCHLAQQDLELAESWSLSSLSAPLLRSWFIAGTEEVDKTWGWLLADLCWTGLGW